MRIFLTGGSGFIGSVLVSELVRRGHTLLLLTRGEPVRVPPERVEYVEGSLAQVNTLCATVKEFQPDAAVHLAWEGIPDFSIDMCITNLRSGCDLFSMLASAGCKKIIGIGSWWEYGNQSGIMKEDMPSIPASPIAAIKTALRVCGTEIAKKNCITFIWARPSFVYGPGQKSTSLIPSVISTLQQGIAPVINNKEASHDFVYVDDVARALCALLEKEVFVSGSSTYNIGFGVATNVVDVVKVIYEVMDKKSLLESVRGNSECGMYADITKIATETGWSPLVSLKEGLTRIINQKSII